MPYACNVTVITADGTKNRAMHQNLKIALQLGLEAEKNQLAILEILEAPNKNKIKWPKK